MLEIKIYKTDNEVLTKNYASIAEKCYYSDEKTCTIVSDESLMHDLDKKLWTYSKKHFIPHATKNDPSPEQQPVYLTDLLDDKNNSTIFILVNLPQQKLIDFMVKIPMEEISKIKKILILFDNTVQIDLQYICDFISKSNLKDSSLNLHQLVKNKWQEVDIQQSTMVIS